MLLSTRQAAVLLDTHESSVKRWCNAGDLSCQTTSGGHRRIQLDTLADFARQGHPSADFLAFGSHRKDAVAGVLALRRGRLSHELLETVQEWLLDAESYKVNALFRVARKFGVGLPVLYDRLIASVMQSVGDSWAIGAFQVGEEHRISESILDVLYGQQALAERKVRARAPAVVLGSIRDEEHVTGAMMVRTLLTEAGWQVAYLGRNVPEEDFLLFQRKTSASMICLSATTSRPAEVIIEVINNLFAFSTDQDDFHIAIGGSGVASARLLESSVSHPDRVHFFDSATEFATWADSFQSIHTPVENEAP